MTLHRRDAMMRLGQLAVGGLTLPGLLRAPALARADRAERSASAKSCILLYLWGGPPQQDMFDMKPAAPDGIRSQFAPMSTVGPGVQLCDQLPKTARHTDKMAIVRSFTHDSDNHIPSVYYTLTGRKDPTLSRLRQRNRQDFPTVGSVAARFAPPGELPPTVTVPRPIGHDGVTYSGTHAGFLGAKYDPMELKPAGETNDRAAHELGLPGGLGVTRLQARFGLLKLLEDYDRQMQATSGQFGGSPGARALRDYRQQAFRMLTSPSARRAFDLQREPAKMRQRYGRNQYGESFLLARRLVEAGVRLVTVVWLYICPDGNVANVWDNHGGTGSLGGITGYEMLREKYCLPPLDQAYSALLDDLSARRLLDETLVVMMGEFGRTPKINKNAGRDHWGAAQSIVLAGGGIRGGQVYGATDRYAAEVVDSPVSPADTIATIHHALGMPPETPIYDHDDRPHAISTGRPLKSLFG